MTSEEDGEEGSNGDPVRKHYKEGNTHFEKGEFSQAIDCYTLAIILDRTFEDAYFNRALAHGIEKEFRDALEDLTKVLELSQTADAYHARGLILERMQRITEAKECYVRALSLNPDYKPQGDKLELLRRDLKKDGKSQQSSESELLQTLAEATRDLRELIPGVFKPDQDESEEERNQPAEPPLIQIVGLYERWTRLQEVVILPLKYHDKEIYQAQVVKSSRGILLYGPPGCGKTLTVSHLTREGGINMLKICLANTLNMYVGESDKRLKEVFDEAIKRAKEGERILIFIDEVDALGFARGGGPDNEASWNRHLLATFLSCFDDIQTYPNIAVVGATNDPFNVDGALRRPGRLGGTTIYIPPPDTAARRELFEFYIKDTPRTDDIDPQELAKKTKWYSGDDIRKICRDVHLKVAPSIAEGKLRTATMSDYLESIKTTKPSTVQWFLDIQRRLAGGLIDEMLLDRDLEQDLIDFANDHSSKDNPSFAVR